MKCRILESNNCIITSKYGKRKLNNRDDFHHGIDIVKNGYTLDYISAHSDGIVLYTIDNKINQKGSGTYGNYVKIEHQNGYSTLYAHMETGLLVKKGQIVKKGQRLGYMGESGDAYGKHLHFEVWKNNSRIDPTDYLDSDFEIKSTKKEKLYNIGEIVQIDGVYISSTSNLKLTPKIKQGKITKIKDNVNNPYLLEEGKIGWINDKCVIKVIEKYLCNKEYKGNSIVDALKQINIDSSFLNRMEIAKKNNISNYIGSEEENLLMLNLLKAGMLKY